MNTASPREVAARVLVQREEGKAFTEDILARELHPCELSGSDRALAQELTYGVVRWQATLDWLIARKAPQRIQKPVLQILLRLGLYQLFWLERIPDHAAVHETVALCKQLGFPRQAGFINAVLRGYLREREHTERILSELKGYQPHLGYSHPEWLVSRWVNRWGREAALQLLEWNNHPPKTVARWNSLRMTRDLLLAAWAQEGVEFGPVKKAWIPEGLMFELKSHPPLAELPSFRAGGFYVQDPSTVLAVRELDAQPGETILDLCAAPGGKTTLIAQFTENRSRIVAEDLEPERLELVRENCARLGVENIEVRVTPAQESEAPRVFDRVLLDAPCSNTGVMRRRVDLRWRLRPEEVQKVTATQQALLQRAAALVKPGGRIVYSTCSLEPEENRAVVDSFLQQNPEFTLRAERELFPPNEQVDGAYVATLEHRGSG